MTVTVIEVIVLRHLTVMHCGKTTVVHLIHMFHEGMNVVYVVGRWYTCHYAQKYSANLIYRDEVRIYYKNIRTQF